MTHRKKKKKARRPRAVNKGGRPPSEKRAEMVQLRARGMTFRAIAVALRCSTSTIQRALEEA